MFNNSMAKLFLDAEETKNDIQWSSLPNEIWAKIIGHMDLETRLHYSACGPREALLANKFANNDVYIQIEHVENGHMKIRMMDSRSNEKKVLLTWKVTRGWFKGTVQVRLTNSSDKILHRKKVHCPDYASFAFRTIVAIFENRMYTVKKLEFNLKDYSQPITFPHQVGQVDELILKDCIHRTKLMPSISNCFYDTPNRINIYYEKETARTALFRAALGYPYFHDAKERFVDMEWLLHSTDFPFHGSSAYRDRDEHLTPEGFNAFLKLILSRDLPKHDPVSRGFTFTRCFIDDSAIVENGLKVIYMDDLTFYSKEGCENRVCVCYTLNCTRGEIHNRF